MMSDGIHSTGVAMHSLFLAAAIHSITDAGLLLRVTGCDAVDRNVVVRLNGSNIAAWQGAHQLALLLLLVVLVLLYSCGRRSRPASDIISCVYFPSNALGYEFILELSLIHLCIT
jgi:hypothetical protein